MKKLEITEKSRAYSESEAQSFIDNARNAAGTDYIVKKATCEYKEKKVKGVVVGEAWIVSITKVFNEIWDEDETV